MCHLLYYIMVYPVIIVIVGGKLHFKHSMTCTADTGTAELGRIQDVQSLVLNIKCLGRLERAQEMREGWKGGRSREGQRGQREEQTNLSPPHW